MIRKLKVLSQMRLRRIGALLLISIFCFSCGQSQSNVLRFGFYNVENLFDLYVDPDVKDDDWTPEGKQQWTRERYQKKLHDLAKVIRALGAPQVLGLCEVENRAVLKDLANTPALKKYRYEIVHFDSPDGRGIDVALLFQPKHLRLIHAHPISSTDPDLITRDVLYASLMPKGKDGDTIHLLVNHWPSRVGGKASTESKRMHMATLVTDYVNGLRLGNPHAAIVVMGDFNDTPTDRSIREMLVARGGLFNPYLELASAGEGTYNYRGSWDMLDQILLSEYLMSGSGTWRFSQAGVLREKWMMFEHPSFGWSPNRTYGGPIYYGGYSDHLPVYLDLKKRK